MESQARDSQCWLEFVILAQKQLHHERINKTFAPGEKPMIFDADMNKKFKKTFCISLFHCNLITG